jgi:hypothetical protein
MVEVTLRLKVENDDLVLVTDQNDKIRITPPDIELELVEFTDNSLDQRQNELNNENTGEAGRE